MNNPKFVTFTGIDEKSNVPDLITLQKEYPVEWGILFSNVHTFHTDHPRYPYMNIVERFIDSNLNLAAHLCGSAAKNIVTTGFGSISCGGEDDPLLDISRFNRVQLNVRQEFITQQNLDNVEVWAICNNVKNVIIQARDSSFPIMTEGSRVVYLFDRSGGKGIPLQEHEIPSVPDLDRNKLHGYAGGINPSNVVDFIKPLRRDTVPYWIDMEAGVRDSADYLDFDKCHSVCNQVYGK